MNNGRAMLAAVLMWALGATAQAVFPAQDPGREADTELLEQPLPGVDPDALQEDLSLLERPVIAQPPQLKKAREESLSRYKFFALLAAGILAAGALIWLMARMFRRRRLRGEAPDVVALRELEQWRDIEDAAKLREAVGAISGTVRRYVESRFGLHAPRLTTEEFWAAQRAARKVPSDYDSFWTHFLDTCDPIKYAGLSPRSAEFQRLFSSSVEFVRASTANRRKEAA